MTVQSDHLRPPLSFISIILCGTDPTLTKALYGKLNMMGDSGPMRVLLLTLTEVGVKVSNTPALRQGTYTSFSAPSVPYTAASPP